MEKNKIQAYGYTSDIEAIENHRKKLSNVPPIFYSMCSVSNKTGIGKKTIYSLLREFNYIDENNIPSQEYVDEGYFQYYIFQVKYKYSGVLSVSPKGINLIHKLYKNNK